MILIGHQAQLFSLFPYIKSLSQLLLLYFYVYISDAIAIGDEFDRIHINAAYSVNKIMFYSSAQLCLCVLVQCAEFVLCVPCSFVV